MRGAAGTLDANLPEGDLPSLHNRLEKLLVARGLYPREARAMVETWKDSWFEPGTRLVYIVPGSFVDSILPLDIRPKPTEVARVFVGRIELLTDARLAAIKSAMLTSDLAAMKQHGRFLWPSVTRVLHSASPDERGRLQRALQVIYQMPTHNLTRCLARRS